MPLATASRTTGCVSKARRASSVRTTRSAKKGNIRFYSNDYGECARPRSWTRETRRPRILRASRSRVLKAPCKCRAKASTCAQPARRIIRGVSLRVPWRAFVIRIWLFFALVLAGLCGVAWATDFITPQGERTVYTAECERGVWQGAHCTGRLAAGARHRFRALKSHKEV